MSRHITAQETAIVEWLLDHAAVGDVSRYRSKPVRSLQVTRGCECGCASLEAYAMHEVADRLPQIADLRRWEDCAS